MARELAFWSFLFPLMLLMFILGHGHCKDMNEAVSNGDKVIRLQSMDIHNSEEENGLHKPKREFPWRVFYTINDLMKVGYRVSINLPPIEEPSSYPPWLTREEADKIPIKYKLFQELLEFFSISPDSPQAKSVQDVLKNCDSPPMEGETKFCATSRESLFDFIHNFFGTKDVRPLTSVHLTSSKTLVQNYTVLQKPQELAAPKVVACHRMAYPYMLYFCHKQWETKAYRVSLAGDNGDRIEAISVCHFDTAQWDPSHQSFEETGTKPGQTDLCHYIPSDHMIWVPTWQARV